MKKEKDLRSETEKVLRQLALGSVADAVNLLMHGEELSEKQLKKLNLTNVAGIKRSSGCITEIKFFDRIKAIERLTAFAEMNSDTGSTFIKALMGSTSEESEDEE